MGHDEGRREEELVEVFLRKAKDPDAQKRFKAWVEMGKDRIGALRKGNRVDPKKLQERVTI